MSYEIIGNDTTYDSWQEALKGLVAENEAEGIDMGDLKHLADSIPDRRVDKLHKKIPSVDETRNR